MLVNTDLTQHYYKNQIDLITARNSVWSTALLDWVAMEQPVIKTDTLTVAGTTDLTKIGGAAVGATNALYVQPGTGATFPVSATDLDMRNLVAATDIVQNKSYLTCISEGLVAGATPWHKLGFNPSIDTTEEDVWSAGGLYVFPTAATAMEVVSSSAGDEDQGTIIHDGGATDADGSKTTLKVTGENFSTTTAVGDLIILDKAGTTPEWGYVTAVTSNTVLTCAGGFSSGGSGASRTTYHVIDVSDNTGVHAVRIQYLDTSWAQKEEIVILDGNAAVDLVGSPYRINSFRSISNGTNNGAVGNITLQANGAGTTYSYITTLYTRARNSVYTVPAGKTLYVVSGTVGQATIAKTADTARVRVKANLVDSTNFIMGGIVGTGVGTFWVYAEEMVSNGSEPLRFPVYPRLPAKVDIKCSATSTGAGAVTTMLRGYLVTA